MVFKIDVLTDKQALCKRERDAVAAVLSGVHDFEIPPSPKIVWHKPVLDRKFDSNATIL